MEGIEELQLHYGLDSNGDGMPDAYVANPNDYPSGSCSGACPRDNWLNVVTVVPPARPQPRGLSGFTNSKRYILGQDAAGNDIERTPSDGSQARL